MRFFSLLFLIIFVVIIGIFTWQNRDDVTVNFLQSSITTSMAIIVGAAFVLGMLTGWSLLRALKKSITRSAEYLERPKPTSAGPA